MTRNILIAESGSGFGGSAKYLTSLLPLLDSKGFHVEVVTYGSGPFVQQMKQDNRGIYFFSMWRFPWQIAETKTKNKWLNKAIYFSCMLLQLIIFVPIITVWLLWKKVDLIHLNNEILSHLPLLIAGRLAGKQIVCHFHGWRNLISTEKLASRYVNKFIAVTQSGADFYSWQLKGKSVEGIPNGLVMEDKEILPETRLNMRQKLGLGDQHFLAILIGRFIPLKGHSVFFRSLAEARQKNPNIRAVVVGNDPSDKGQYLAKLKSELKALQIEDIVMFLPWQDHMGPVYQASDVVVQPSVEPESFGYVALEGMAESKPVIGSKLGGLMDVIKDGETGFLVEAGNSHELAKALLRIAGDASFAASLGARGHERAKTLFNMQHNAERIAQTYDYLLNPNRILIAESGSGFGGTAKYLANLLSAVKPNLFSVTVVGYGNGPLLKEIQRKWPLNYCPAWRYPWGEKDEIWGKVLSEKTALRWLNYIYTASLSLVEIFIMVPIIWLTLKRRSIRLVHLNNGIRSHIPLLIAAKLSGARIICHFHGWRPFTHTEKWLASWVDQFIAISEAGSDFLKQQIPNQKIMAIPNGLSAAPRAEFSKERLQSERALLNISKEAKVVSIIGRLVEWKGQEIYLKALAHVAKNNPQVVGIILGHDPAPNQDYLKKLQAMSASLGISSSVRFLPWQDDVQPIYAISDVVVHASTDPEPFGLVILEAMFAGKPVVATKGGGVADLIVHEQSGLLVEPNQPEELAAAILKLISDPRLAVKLGQAGEERAKVLFSIERNASQMQALYTDLLNKQEAGSSLRKRRWHGYLKQAIFTTGAVSLARESVASKVPVLMYHKISETPDPFFPSVSINRFREQMSYIKRFYNVISMDELVKTLKSGGQPQRKSAVVTFDDGNAATLFLALPVLQEMEIPVTVFLSAAPTDESNFIWTDLLRLWFKLTRKDQFQIQLNGHIREWKLDTLQNRLEAVHEISDQLKKMSNDDRKRIMGLLGQNLGLKNSELPNDWILTQNQIKYLVKANIKFGAHTMTHPILSRMPLREARYEIFESKRWLENILNDKVRHFAYPNGEAGDFTAEHENLVAQAGFDSAATTIIGLNESGTNPYALRRIYAAEEPLAHFASRLVGIGS